MAFEKAGRPIRWPWAADARQRAPGMRAESRVSVRRPGSLQDRTTARRARLDYVVNSHQGMWTRMFPLLSVVSISAFSESPLHVVESVHGVSAVGAVGRDETSLAESQESTPSDVQQHERIYSDTPLHVVELVDANGRSSRFEFFAHDLDAPAAAVSAFCRHTHRTCHGMRQGTPGHTTSHCVVPHHGTPCHALV